MACEYRAPNGEPSLLYSGLEIKFGPKQAEKLWYETRSRAFTEVYKEFPQDPNGEPTADWVASVLTHGTQKQLPASRPTVEIKSELFTRDGASEENILKRIKDLYDTAAKNPDKTYPVPFKRNTPGIKRKGGPRLPMTALAELFLKYPIPENVVFDPTFQGLMSVTPSQILSDVLITPPSAIEVNAQILERSKESTLLKMRDENGQPVGWFSYEKQQEAIDSLIYIIYSRYMKGVTSVQDIQNSAEQLFRGALTRYLDIIRGKKFKGFEDVTKAMAEQRAKDLQDILNVFYIKTEHNNLWNFALDKLKLYGLNIKGLGKLSDEQGNQIVDHNDGVALRDYRDSSFELDRKDTASSRIKLFLSSIEDSDDRKVVRMTFSSALVREQILSGEKTTTIRSAEIAAEIGLSKGESAITRIDNKMVLVTSLGPVTKAQIDTYADVAAQEQVELKEGMHAYSLKVLTDDSQLATKKNYLGMPKLINFEDAFQKLMALLSNQEPSLNNYMGLMNSSTDPVIRRVHERLDKETIQVKNEFVSVMSNQYQQFTVVLFGKQLGKDGITRIQSRSFMANYGSQINVLLRGWEQFQKQAPIITSDVSGNMVINQAVAQDLLTKLMQVIDAGTYNTTGVSLFKELLSANGIELSDAFYDNFVKNADKITKGTGLQGNFERQFSFNKDGQPAGLISTLISRLNGRLQNEEEQEDNSLQVNNPMYTEGSSMNILARAALQYTPMIYSNSHRSSEGKSIYDHGFNTSLSHRIRRLKTDEEYRKEWGQTYINEHNPLLRELYNNPELRDRFQLTYMDGIKPEYKGATGTTRTEMSMREQMLYSLALFEKRGSTKYADYISLTHSDKTTSPVFLNAPRIKVVTGQKVVEGPGGFSRIQTVTDDVYKALWSLFLDEYNRVTKTTESYNLDQFDKGKKFFFAMPEFNFSSMQDKLKRGEITKEEFNALWTDLGAIKPVETTQAKQLLLKLFNRRIEILTNRTYQSWIKEGLLTKDSVPFSMKYMNRLMYAIGVTAAETAPGSFVYLAPDGQSLSAAQSIEIAGKLAARDYAINHFIFNVSSSRLFYGDPAEVFKKDVATTMVDYAKRLAKDIAPGKDGEWSHSPQYTAVAVEDWEGPSHEVKELVLAYDEGVNATDGQEIITVQEWLDGKLAIGQVSKQVYDEMTQIIKEARGKYYEFTKPEHKLIMTPQKPVYVGEGKLQNGVKPVHYIKPSAYPLLPAYTAGKQLDVLRQAMETQGVARVYFTSAGKVGRPGVKLRLFDQEGNMDTTVLNSPAFTGKDADGNPVPSARQVLDRKGFRIQQEVPHDPDKRKIGLVTQMNKMIVQGISTISTPFIYQGNQVTAKALIDAKTELRKRLFDLMSEDVLTGLGVKDGELKDYNKLYDSLFKEASSRPGYSLNDIELLRYRDDKGEPLIPMIFSPSRERFESLLMNKIGAMTELKIFGRSFVQASSAGLKNLSSELSEADKKRIVFAGSYRGGDLKTLRHEDGEVKPAQVLVPFNFFAKGRKLNIQDFIITDENGYQVIDPSKIPVEFLQLVAARIPNQGHSSMLPVEIVGFLPDEMGDTIIVPAAITKQMGSDFDVDKLYTYQRAYEYDSTGQLQYSDKYEEKLLNAYFDIHWSVLMHPEMTQRILSPLDKPDLELEAAKVPVPEGFDFFDVMEQLESFQSQKFAKQLVGFAALTLTNNAVFEQMNVTLGQQMINEETGDPVTLPAYIPMVDANGVVHELDRLSGHGQSTNHDIEGKPTRTKNDNIVMMLSGFLDHAKKPITPQINLNLYTYNAAAALLRLQSQQDVAPGIPELAALLRQPVILEYSSMMSAANDSLSETFEPDLHTKVMSELGRKYMELGGTTTSRMAPVDIRVLRSDLTPQDTKPYYQRQLDVLLLFNTLWKMGRQLADVQSAFNWDVGGPGPSLLNAQAKQNVISDTAVTNAMPMGIVLNNMEDMYNTEQGYIRGKLFDAINNVAIKVFPYDKLEPVLDVFKERTGSSFISPKVQKLLIDGYLAYQWMHAPVWGGDEDVKADRIRLLYSGQHGPSLARRLQDAKISWGRGNYLLQRIEGNIAPSGSGPDFVNYTLGLTSGFDALEIARSWNSLLISDNETHKRLGEDLVRYAILTGNSSTLARHIPISYILGTSLIEATGSLQTGEAVSEIFIQQFLQHYPQYAKTLSEDLRETGHTYETYPETFKVLPVDYEVEEHSGRALWVKKDGVYAYPEFLSYRDTQTNKWILYQQTSYLNYERIDTLGNSQIDEYSPVYGESVIPENKAFKKIQESQPEARHSFGNTIGDTNLSKTGNYDAVLGMLDKIRSTTTEPVLYRQMAELLIELPRTLESRLLEYALDRELPEFNYEITDKLRPGIDAVIESGRNKLLISSELPISGLSATLIHEMIHYHTTGTVTLLDAEDNPEYYKSRMTPAGYEELLKNSRRIKATMPEVYEKVKALNSIREQAMKKLKAEALMGKGWEQLYQTAIKGELDKIPTQLQTTARLIYAFGSNTEFLSHIFTDKDVMTWLNNRKVSGKKSLWDQVADTVSSILKAVAEFLGIGVERGSLLEAGVIRAMDLMRMGQTIPTFTQRGVMNINPDAFKNSSITTATTKGSVRKVDTILARLKDQRREIRQTFTGISSKEQAARKRQLLDQLDKQINDLSFEQDLSLIAEVGKTQMKWVTEIMERKDTTANDIMVADRILELWTNLITIMYGDQSNLARVDEQWADIASKAQMKRQQLTNMAIDRIITESKGTLGKRDFSPKELEDLDWTSVRIRGFSSAAKGKALQWIATYMEQANRMVNEEVLRTLKQTKQLEDDFIKYAGGRRNLQTVYNKLMQENPSGTAWGLVRKYSGVWYGFLKDMKYKREHRIDVINRDRGLSAKQKADMKRIAWQDYWKGLESQAAFVDTRLFFDDKGDNHPGFDKAFKELEDQVGTEQATAAVTRARTRYKEYLEEKTIFTDMMEADVLAGSKTRQQADEAILEWTGRYSPNLFFGNFKNQFQNFNVNTTDRFVVMIPKARHTKYFDKKFSELQKDPELYSLYTRLHEHLMKMKSYLPKGLQYELGDNFLPVVALSLVSDLSAVPEYVRGMPDRFVRSLTATAYEEKNKGQERIPISYVDTSKTKDPGEVASRSRDLVRITELFSGMAIHYKHFAAAKDVIDMGQSIIREIDNTRARDGKIVDENGTVLQAPQGLKNAIEGLQYMKEYIMFKRAKLLEGNTGLKIYSLNPAKQNRIAARVKELTIQRRKLDEQLLTGEIEGQQWKDQTKVIDDELSTYEGRPVYGSKIGDKLISIQQAKSLSYNPFSAVANWTFGIVSAAIFANGRQEFGNSEFVKALRIMMSSSAKWASFGAVIPDEARKIMNVMDRLGVMGDVVDSQYGKLESRDRIPQWKKTINPYAWLRSGDYFCRGLNTVATLLKSRVKVTVEGIDKEISLWEALDNNGQWNEELYGQRPEWFSENVEDQTAWNKMRDKVARVNMIIMGNVDHSSPKMANKWIIGRLLGQFRLSWLPEGWYSRFAEEKYDIQLERYTKGRYQTYKDLGIGGSLRVLGKQFLSVVAKTDPFTGEHRMSGEKMSDADIENMRRNFAELNFYLGIVAVILMLKSMHGDDDDDDSVALQTLINMVLRMKQDVAFYSSPEVFDTVTRNAVPAFGVIKDYGKFMDATWKIMTDDDYTADRWLLKMTKAGLPIPQAALVNKIKYMTERDLDEMAR